jgi:hypothetical protein
MTSSLAIPNTIPADLLSIDGAGLQFNRPPTLEEWQGAHGFLLNCRRASLRWIADSRKVGRENFGDDVVHATEEQLMLDLGDSKAASALEALPARSAGLTDEHLLAIKKRTGTEEGFRKWVRLAEEQKLTVPELVASLKAGRVVRADENRESVNANDKSVGIVTIEGISTSFEMWLRKVQETGFPDGWSDDQLARVKVLLKPMSEAFMAVRETQRQRQEAK